MFPGQLLTMKWSNRIAQGSSPGFGMQSKRALKASSTRRGECNSGRARVPARRENVPEPNGVFSSAVIKRARLR